MRINTAAFYDAFERAGFLHMASWQSAAVGGAVQRAAVRYQRSSTAPLFEGQARGYQASILIPATQWPEIRSGDRLTVEVPGESPRRYRVHEVELITGGSQRHITLKT